MDVSVVQTKEGSSLRFLPVILLEKEDGEGNGEGGRVCEMEAEGRAGCCATESTCCELFHPAGVATPAPPQLSRQSGHRRKPLERPQPPASSVERLRVCAVREEPRTRPYATAYASRM